MMVNYRDMARNVMARDKVLYDGHAVAAVAATSAASPSAALKLIEVDYEVLPHVTDVEEAMAPGRAAAARRHVHRRRRAEAGQALERRQAHRVRARRRGRRLRRGRRRRRARPSHRRRAPGLHRAARLRRQLGPRTARPSCGAAPRAISWCAPTAPAAARHGHLQAARHRVGDRRRLRRQDGGLSRAAGAGAVAQVRPAGQDGDDPRRGLPRHRPDLRRQGCASRSAPPRTARSPPARPN